MRPCPSIHTHRTSYICIAVFQTQIHTQGAREIVAKALALECLRGAHRQRRPCYLYAFSGPSERST